jgi:hypothetical protein
MTIQSEESQEIICTNCGRPNLPEAVKCWYCQSELTNSEEMDQPQDEMTFEMDNPAEQAGPAAKPIAETAGNEEENIPEWLQRIREKEQKERASQAARDQWQQQALFNGSSGSRHAADEPLEQVKAQAHKHKEKHLEEPAAAQTPPVEEEPVEQPPLASAQPQPPQPKEVETIIEEDEILSDESSEDLPAGFIKFDSNSN